MGCSCSKVKSRFLQKLTHLRQFQSKIRDTINGGPVHWIHENYICWPPNCQTNPYDSCCQNLSDDQTCKADSEDLEDDPDVCFI